MANEPIDLLPCRPTIPPSPYNFSQRSGDSGQYDPGDYWNVAFNASGLPLINSLYQLEGNNLSSSFPTGFNSSSSVPFSRHIPPPDLIITNPIFITFTISSILGNLAMLGVILLSSQFRKPANYLIVNLALSSILFIISANLRMIENGYYTWEYNTFRCRLLAVLHRIPVPCVALTTMVISLDRGRVARNPMNCSSTISPAWKSVFIWSFSLIIVIPLAFTRKYDECIPFAYKCAKVVLFGRSSLSMLYGVAYLLSVHIVPAVILMRESVKTQKIMRFLKLSSIEHKNQQLECAIVPYPTSNIFPDNRLRLLRNSCWFTTIFLVFWLPYGIFQFPLDLPKEILPELLEIYVRFYFRFIRNIAYLQIALNPVVLFALSYDLRMYLARVKCDWRYRMNAHRHDSRCNRLDHAIRSDHSLP